MFEGRMEASVNVHEDYQYDTCPCPTCITCACCATPRVDEDGLCISCGGQPLTVAQQHVGFRAPHCSPEILGEEAARIAAIIGGAVESLDRHTARNGGA
jgi:hypothetical protein